MTKQKIETKKVSVPALERASRLLDLVATQHEPLALSDAARSLDLAKSSVHSLYQSLTELGLLERSGTGVVIGSKAVAWAHAFLNRSDLASEFVQFWNTLNEPCNETVTLTILDGQDVIYVASQAGIDPISINFKIGMRLPAVFTATGKAILSTLPSNTLQQDYANGLPAPLTPYSVNTLPSLQAELAFVRERGFSIDKQQVRSNLVCLGAPIYSFSSGTQAVGGIALSIQATSLDEHTKNELSEKVMRYAQGLSQRLGANK